MYNALITNNQFYGGYFPAFTQPTEKTPHYVPENGFIHQMFCLRDATMRSNAQCARILTRWTGFFKDKVKSEEL